MTPDDPIIAASPVPRIRRATKHEPAGPVRLGGARPPAPPSFEAVLEEHGEGVLRFCIARLGPDRGEDCFQDTLIAALRGYAELRDPAAVRAWLFAIAHRKIIDDVRARERTPVPTDGLEDRSGATPASSADRHPAADGIWSRVAQLPAKQREAVGLRFLADLTHAEIAGIMETSEEAARRNVFEGVRRLRADLTNTAAGASS